MKKILLVAFTVFCLICVGNVNAAGKHIYECDEKTYIGNGDWEKVCYIKVQATHPSIIIGVSGTITVKNMELKKIETVSPWVNNSNGLNVKFTSATGLVGNFTVAKITFSVDNTAAECSTDFIPDPPTIEKRYCEIIDGYYYGSNGSLVTKEQYDQECGTTPPVCEIKDGNYYGPNGQIVTEDKYYELCDKENPNKPVCEIKDGNYYGPNGQIVTEDKYYELCDKENPNKPVCEIKDGNYYGPNGQIVTEDKYYELCDKENPNKPVCEIKDGNYYGPNGQIVTEDKYYELCDKENPNKPTCEIKDGNYYGPNGQIVTEDQYYELCDKENPNKPTCEIKDGNYYGPDGELLTKDQFEILCPIINPPTGIDNPYVFIFLGLILLGSIGYYSTKNKGLFMNV